jgi:hypothetical protein
MIQFLLQTTIFMILHSALLSFSVLQNYQGTYTVTPLDMFTPRTYLRVYVTLLLLSTAQQLTSYSHYRLVHCDSKMDFT